MALDVLERAKQATSPAAKPNVFTYSAAISACARAGEWEPALRLLDEMEDSGLQVSEGGRRTRALILALILVLVLATATALPPALTFYPPPSNLQPDAVAFNAALHACRSGSQWRAALETLRRMQDAGHDADIISITDVVGALSGARTGGGIGGGGDSGGSSSSSSGGSCGRGAGAVGEGAGAVAAVGTSVSVDGDSDVQLDAGIDLVFENALAQVSWG